MSCRAKIVMLLVLTGCGAGRSGARGAPATGADPGDLRDGEGLIMGKFGVPRFHALGAVARQMQVRAVDPAGPSQPLSFREELSDDEGRTAPFLARLPAGRYQITAWRLRFLTSEDAQEQAEVEFEVRPGRTACIGALYPLHLWRPSGVPYVTAVIPRDECLLIQNQLGPRLPEDLPPVDVALAAHRLCRPCRAEVAQGGADPLTGPHDTGDLPVLLAERQRLGSGDEMPLRWPTGLPADTRKALRLRVCVSAEGRVVEARVVESVHAALDAQVVTAVLGWRFRPFVQGGVASSFCYHPRWELHRPATSLPPATSSVQPAETQRR